MFRRIAPVLTLVLLVPTLAAAAPKGKPARTGGKAEVDGIAAIVDSVTILKSEVGDQAAMLASQPNMGVNLKDPAAAKKFKNDVLDRMVEEKVIAAEAHRQGVSVDQAEVDAQVDQALANARKALGSDEAYQAQLRREGLDEAGLRKRYVEDFRNQLAARKLVQREVQSKVTADSADAKAYFEAHKAELPKRPVTYRLSVILIGVKASDAVKAKVKDRAAGVLARVKAGEDFAKLATLFSDDPSARDGGALKTPNGDAWIGRGVFDSTFEKAAWALKTGQTSDLVETRFGFHVIKMDSLAGDKAKMSHILLMVTPEPADSSAAMQKALAVRSRAVSGEDFGKLATQFSEDPETRARGGELDPRDLNSFQDPEMAKVIGAMLPSQISSPLKTRSGLVIFRLNAKEDERPYQYGEIEQELENLARQDKTKAAYDKWVAGLKQKHRVTVKYFTK